MERRNCLFCVLMPGRFILVDLRKKDDRETIETVERGRRFSYVLMPGRSILVDLRKREY